MNTLIANQYGRVQGEAGSCGLTLCVTAQTPRRESVELQTRVDSVEQQLHLCLPSCALSIGGSSSSNCATARQANPPTRESFRDHLRRRGSVPLERFAIEEEH